MSSDDLKSEKATPRKRQGARDSGRVAVSRDLACGAATLAVLLVVKLCGGGLAAGVTASFQASIAETFRDEPLNLDGAASALRTASLSLLGLVWPLAAAGVGAAVLCGLVQSGMLFRPAAVAPDPSQLWAGRGALPQPGALPRGCLCVAKLVLLGALLVVVARRWLGVVAGFDARPEGVESFAADGLGLALDATIFGALGIVVLGLVDWGCQRWRLERALRMTRRELLDERRAGEGDPELRRAWRRRGRSLLRRWLRREATERDRDANGDRLG